MGDDKRQCIYAGFPQFNSMKYGSLSIIEGMQCGFANDPHCSHRVMWVWQPRGKGAEKLKGAGLCGQKAMGG